MIMCQQGHVTVSVGSCIAIWKPSFMDIRFPAFCKASVSKGITGKFALKVAFMRFLISTVNILVLLSIFQLYLSPPFSIHSPAVLCSLCMHGVGG